jgi:hypothetical protein
VVYTWDTDALDMPKSIVKFGGYDWQIPWIDGERKVRIKQESYTRIQIKIFPDEQENRKSWWYWCTRAFWLAENSNLLIAPKHLRLIAGRACKTADIIAERSQNVIYDMPKAIRY